MTEGAGMPANAAVATADLAQRAASDPASSAFVSASAGSGKTKLLIDRLLRLMLPGEGRVATPPERILCLTFTKAGAAEMAIRLRRRLSGWVVMEEEALGRALASLDLPSGSASRQTARALFARVLDMQGGLRISTIHAFCEQLLRRFPLEASISPHFRLVEDVDGRHALETAREGAIGPEETAEAVRALAARVDARAHGALTSRLRDKAERLVRAHGMTAAALADALRDALAIAASDARALAVQAATGMDAAAIRAAAQVIAERGAAGQQTTAARLLALLASFADRTDEGAGPDETLLAEWRDIFLTAKLEPRQILTGSSKLRKTDPELAETLTAESERLLGIEHEARALALIEATASLLALSGPALLAYDRHKAGRGLVDFDDLIGRTKRLLQDPGAAWVLFKLDGGLDHLLLDEVQDTSASQWEIAGRLTEEFFTGQGQDHGRGSTPRTMFAVGDPKQSIYAFQGADPEAFHRWRATIRRRCADAGALFREPALTVSFRSAPAILRFVDAVFAREVGRAGVVEPGAAPLAHASASPGLPGRVEVWPLARATALASPASPWEAGPDAGTGTGAGALSGEQRLAFALADHLASLVASGEAAPGEILVLVRRRQGFAGALMRALKARDVPVAGLDRMVLTDQPAVQDLLALCDALLLPDDDLALATMLTSPLGFLDDDGLMALAIGRGEASLAATLAARADERPAWRRAQDFFASVAARADYVTPHGLLSLALGEQGGRARLLARLGPEAGEAIDELLAASLAHEAANVPSLQEFVFWLRRSGAEVKREPGEAASGVGEVRLMTVHASKGLEARFVVLADTTSLPKLQHDLLWTGGQADESLPVWVPGRALACRSIEAFREAETRRTFEEYNRLLYVALTRAKQRLLVCGWETRRSGPQSWYAQARDALAAVPGAAEAAFAPAARDAASWEGSLLVLADGAPAGAGIASTAAEMSAAEMTAVPSPAPEPALPGWAGRAPHWRARPPALEETPRRVIAPSRPDGIVWGEAPQSASPHAAVGRAAARRRGSVLHALLQHLPAVPSAARQERARRFARARLDTGGPGASPGADPDADADILAAEAMAVIGDPRLALVFGPDGRAEQRLAGVVGGVAIAGVVDRIAIGADAIELVDFKSGRNPPVDVEATPVAYLRQMAAYRAVLQACRPGVEVRCRLVWTATGSVHALPDALLDRHVPGLSDAAGCALA